MNTQQALTQGFALAIESTQGRKGINHGFCENVSKSHAMAGNVSFRAIHYASNFQTPKTKGSKSHAFRQKRSLGHAPAIPFFCELKNLKGES